MCMMVRLVKHWRQINQLVLSTVDSEGPRFESCSGPSLSLRSHYTTIKSLPHLCVCVACHTYDIVLSLVYIIFAHVHTQVHG